jgi:hypothetical protein
MKTITMTALALAVMVSAASAQTATVRSTNPMNPSNLGFTVGSGPMRPCTLTPAQLQETRRVAMEFFRPGSDRVAIADPRYTQHNPGFLKPAIEMKLSDFDYFKSRFGGPPAGAAAPAAGARAGGAAPAGGGGGRGNATPPPAGNPTEIVLQEWAPTTRATRSTCSACATASWSSTGTGRGSTRPRSRRLAPAAAGTSSYLAGARTKS